MYGRALHLQLSNQLIFHEQNSISYKNSFTPVDIYAGCTHGLKHLGMQWFSHCVPQNSTTTDVRHDSTWWFVGCYENLNEHWDCVYHPKVQKFVNSFVYI